MRGQEMRTEVIGQHDTAAPQADRGVEVFPSDHGEHVTGTLVGNAVQEQVSRSPQNMIAGQFATHGGDVPLTIEHGSAVADGIVKAVAQALAPPVFHPADARNETRCHRQRQRPNHGQDGPQETLADVEPASFHRRISSTHLSSVVAHGPAAALGPRQRSRTNRFPSFGQIGRQVGDPA